jgi:hypothetical protein
MLKAIETRYKGYRFRSRTEARWAVFFDALKMPYEYEKEGFDLGSIGFYLPDFWMPRAQMWIEIKGTTPTTEEVSKVEYLSIDTKTGAMIVSGMPMDEKLMLFDPDSRYWFRDKDIDDVSIWCELALIHPLHEIIGNFCDPIRAAYDAARSARFEHGETP